MRTRPSPRPAREADEAGWPPSCVSLRVAHFVAWISASSSGPSSSPPSPSPPPSLVPAHSKDPATPLLPANYGSGGQRKWRAWVVNSGWGWEAEGQGARSAWSHHHPVAAQTGRGPKLETHSPSTIWFFHNFLKLEKSSAAPSLQICYQIIGRQEVELWDGTSLRICCLCSSLQALHILTACLGATRDEKVLLMTQNLPSANRVFWRH